MDELLKYTRLVFEVRFLEETSIFKCIISLVKEGIFKCICIPGVAANYILRVLDECVQGFEGTNSIEWDSTIHRYIVKCKDKNNKMWFANFTHEAKETNYGDEVCTIREKEKLTKELGVEYAYIRLRDKITIRTAYGITGDKYRLETALYLLPEKSGDRNNKRDLVSLFSYIAEECNRDENYSMEKYLDILFRLYVFLFPEETMGLIKMKCQHVQDAEFHKYNKQVLLDYQKMATEIGTMKNYRVNDTLIPLSEYLKIDFDMVYNYYSKSDNSGDVKDLQEILVAQVNVAKDIVVQNLQEVLFELEYNETV